MDAPERVLWWFPSGGLLSPLDEMTSVELGRVLVRPFSLFQAGSLIVGQWDEPGRRVGCRKSLQALLESSGSILHVVQDGSVAFQWALLEAASRAGYRHRVVSWRSPLQCLRAVVREGKWNGIDSKLPPLLRENQRCQNRLTYLLRLMDEGDHRWELVEPVGTEGDWARGLPPVVSERLRDQALAVQLPLTEAQEQLLTLESGWLTGLEQLPTLLRPKLVRPSIEDARVKLVRLEGIPPLLPRGSAAKPVALCFSTVPSLQSLRWCNLGKVQCWHGHDHRLRWRASGPIYPLLAKPACRQSRFWLMPSRRSICA